MSASKPVVEPVVRLAPLAFDDVVLGVVFVLLASLPFLLGDQATRLVSAEQMGMLSAEEGDRTKQILLVILYASMGLLLVTRTRPASWMALGLPLALLLLLCFVSVTWSDLPSRSFRRAVAVAGTVAIGLYAGLRMDEHRLVRVLLVSGAIALLASFAVAAAMPASGLDPEGRLRGVFSHKNSIGSFAALCMLALLLASPADRRLRAASWAMVGLCAVTIVLSDSVTPVVAVLFALTVVWLRRRAGTRVATALLVAAMLAGLLLPFFAGHLGPLASLIGRNPEFSGRTHVWLFGIEFLNRSPGLGYGYAAFWSGPAAPIFQRWSGFPVPHAHNGYLELGLGLGLPGILLAIAALTRVIRAQRTATGDSGVFMAGMLAFMLVAHMTESRIFNGNDILPLLFVYLSVRAHRPRHAPSKTG